MGLLQSERPTVLVPLCFVFFNDSFLIFVFSWSRSPAFLLGFPSDHDDPAELWKESLARDTSDDVHFGVSIPSTVRGVRPPGS